MEIVLATGNAGKAREFQTILRALLDDPSLTFSDLSAYPSVVMPPEGGDYATNARAKALTLARALGRFALADDSGIEVEALGGLPGPYSARYRGDSYRCHLPDEAARAAHVSDTERVALLLAEIADVALEKRGARYVCVAAFATPAGEVFTARGECAGVLCAVPQGRGGFGYDPVFFVPEAGKTMAELPEMEKHRLSHRGRALRALRDTILCELRRVAR